LSGARANKRGGLFLFAAARGVGIFDFLSLALPAKLYFSKVGFPRKEMLQKNLRVEQQGPIQNVEQINIPGAQLALGFGMQAF
jgi:hypothetical protein